MSGADWRRTSDHFGRSLPTAARTSHRTLGGGSRSAPPAPPPLSLRGRRRSRPRPPRGPPRAGQGLGLLPPRPAPGRPAQPARPGPALPPPGGLHPGLPLLPRGLAHQHLGRAGQGHRRMDGGALVRRPDGRGGRPLLRAPLPAPGGRRAPRRRGPPPPRPHRPPPAAGPLRPTSPPRGSPRDAAATDARTRRTPSPGPSRAPPGDGGYAGHLFGSTLATWFGAPGAALLLIPFALLGFGLLCGWSLAAWRRLARRSGGALGRAGRGAWSVARAFWTGLTWSGRRLSRAAVVTGRIAGERAAGGAHLLAGRFRSWSAALIALRLSPSPAGPLTLPLPSPAPPPDLPQTAGAPGRGDHPRRPPPDSCPPSRPPSAPPPGPTSPGSCPPPPSSPPPRRSRSARPRWPRRPA